MNGVGFVESREYLADGLWPGHFVDAVFLAFGGVGGLCAGGAAGCWRCGSRCVAGVI